MGEFKDAYESYLNGLVDGLGFVVTTDDDFVAIDLDHCVGKESRKREAWAVEIIQTLASYSEFSPSGEGIRIFVRGSLPDGQAGRKKGKLEIYSAGRYLTMTGHRLKNAPTKIEPRQEAINQVYAAVFAEERKPKKNNSGNGSGHLLTDDELLAKAFDARNGNKLAPRNNRARKLIEQKYSRLTSR